MTEYHYEVTEEMRELARIQVANMKEREVSKRWFTTATKNIIHNAINSQFKDEVSDAINDKLDSWTSDLEEYNFAMQTAAYGANRIATSPSTVTREDYVEYLANRVIATSLESRLFPHFKESVTKVFGFSEVQIDDEVIM